MTRKTGSGRAIAFRLIHDGTQPGKPLAEPLRFGLQDTKGEVHPGRTVAGAGQHLEFSLEVSGDETAPPRFRGAFAHGPATARFVYLGWKREGEHEHPWGWRIKIPLAAVGWTQIRAAEASGTPIEADVTGRRPHTSETVHWRVA